MADINSSISLLTNEIKKREAEILVLQDIIKSFGVESAPLPEPKTIHVESAKPRKVKNLEEAEAVPTRKKRTSKKRKGSVIGTVLNALKNQQRFMDSREIAELVIRKHPERADDPEKLQKYLAVVLSNHRKSGEIVGIKQNQNGEKLNRNYWGLPKWVSEAGMPMMQIGEEA